MIIAIVQSWQKFIAVIRGAPVDRATYLTTETGEPITTETGEAITIS